MIFHRNLSNNKSPLSLLSILADLNNTVVWMISTFPLIYKSSSTFTNPIGIVPSAVVDIISYRLIVSNANTWNHIIVYNIYWK